VNGGIGEDGGYQKITYDDKVIEGDGEIKSGNNTIGRRNRNNNQQNRRNNRKPTNKNIRRGKNVDNGKKVIIRPGGYVKLNG